MPHIFISYRREDSQVITGRIHSNLSQVFGNHSVFFDRYNIPAGTDFRQYLQAAIQKSDVVLVIVGQKWLNITEEGTDKRRLDDLEDFVRLEIRTALEHGKLIIPLLVDSATMPRAHEVPEDIKDFTYRNARSIRHDPDYPRDVEDLIERLRDFNKTGVTGFFRRSSNISPQIIGGFFVFVLMLTLIFAWILNNPSNFGFGFSTTSSVNNPTATTEQIIIPAAIISETLDATSSSISPTNTANPTDTATAISTSTMIPTETPTATANNTEMPISTATIEAINIENANNIQESNISPLLAHNGAILSIQFTPDGHRIISGGLDETIRIWDAQSGQLLESIPFGIIFDIAVDPQGRYFVAAGAQNPKVWDLNTYQEVEQLSFHNNTLRTVQFNQDGSKLASIDETGIIAIWDAETWNRLTVLDFEMRGYDIVFPASGNLIIADREDGNIQAWNTNTYTQVYLATVETNTRLYGLALHPTEPIVAIGANNSLVYLWNYNNSSVSTLPDFHKEATLSLEFSNDGEILLVGDRRGDILIWDYETQTVLKTIDYQETYGVPLDNAVIYDLAFSPDNHSFAAASKDGVIRIFTLP